MRYVAFILIVGIFFGCSPVVETSEEFPDNAVLDVQASIAYLDKIIDHDHDNAEALFKRARLRMDIGDELHAKEDVIQALEVAPSDPDYLFLKARIDEALGQHAEAIQTIEKLKKSRFFVNTLEFELFASDLYLKTKNFNLAGYYLQNAAEKLPNHIEVLYQRAKLYAATYDTSKSIAFYKMVLAKDSVHDRALLHLAEIFQRRKHSDTTLFYLRKVAGAKGVEYHLLVGEALRDLGKADSAVQHWLKVTHLSPRNPSAHYELGKYYFVKGDIESSNQHLSLVPENERNRLKGFYNLFVKVNERLGNVELALSLFHKQNLQDSSQIPKPKVVTGTRLHRVQKRIDTSLKVPQGQ